MGSSGNKAQKQAQAAEDARQKQIADSTAAINAIFNDPARTQQYADLQKSTTDYLTGDVNRQQAEASRKLQFALARSGQAGGSAGAYQGKVLGQDYTRALDKAAQAGYQAGANLRQSDEQSRQQLIGLAQTGIDTTTAADEAARWQKSNLESARGNATANQMGDAFANLMDTYQQSQQRQQQRQGYLYGYGSVYQPMYGLGSSNPNYGG